MSAETLGEVYRIINRLADLQGESDRIQAEMRRLREYLRVIEKKDEEFKLTA